MIMWKPNSESTTTLKQVDYLEPAKSRVAATGAQTASNWVRYVFTRGNDMCIST